MTLPEDVPESELVKLSDMLRLCGRAPATASDLVKEHGCPAIKKYANSGYRFTYLTTKLAFDNWLKDHVSKTRQHTTANKVNHVTDCARPTETNRLKELLSDILVDKAVPGFDSRFVSIAQR